jgi:glycosyltransferase involved in cell wall biosynthesis
MPCFGKWVESEMRPRPARPDGLPAGAASGPTAVLPGHGNVAIQVSVVVPAYNNAAQLGQCLSALRAAADAEVEMIVVDDASADDLSSAAARFGAQILRLTRNAGPAAARNHGARLARGRILFFVDADVVVATDAIGRIRMTLDRRPQIAALFGSYDSSPAAPGLVSQYRNLLHHFMHQNGKTEAATFWAGCGAVRRSAFERVGGFDERRFPRPSIEDVELGYRLRRAGYRIFLDKSLQATHLKRWTLWSVVRTDVFCRAIPWSRLIIESGGAMPDDLNLGGSQRASLALTGLGSLLLLASPLRVELLIPAFACVAAVIMLNRHLYAFFRRTRGTLFAAACVPLHLLYYVCCGLGYQYVWMRSMLRI